MAEPAKIVSRRRGWHRMEPGGSVLGLMAIAFLWDRIAPPDRVAKPEKGEAFPETAEADRHASPAEIATEDGNRGRQASSPADPGPRMEGYPLAGLWQYRRSPRPRARRRHDLLQPSRYFSCHRGARRHLRSVLRSWQHRQAPRRRFGLYSGGAVEVAREQLTRVATKGDRTLGFTFAIGLAISLWSANAAMKSLFDTLNIVYGEQEKARFLQAECDVAGIHRRRNRLRRWRRLARVVVIPVVLQYVGHVKRDATCLSGSGAGLHSSSVWPLPWLAFTGFGPSRQAPRWTWITWGSAAAAPALGCGIRPVFLLRRELRHL